MKIILAALNSKYIHTNLAVRSVKAYAGQRGIGNIEIWERTINHHYDRLLFELYEQNAGLVVFSCYIWNIRLICRLAQDLRKLCPDMVIAAAGPEVSYHMAEFLAQNPAFDYILPGEGELLTWAFCKAAAAAVQDQRRCLPLDGDILSAVCGRHRLAAKLPPPRADLDELAFPYQDIDELAGRILYYESMRGCPYACTYCMSSVDRSVPRVRYRSLERVFCELDVFLQAGVKQVKFVDRTFNADRSRALKIWRYLQGRDNHITNFHFEINGALLDEETLDFLRTVRSGLFQFEIGVQSTNPETLRAIRRDADIGKIFEKTAILRQYGNIHLHLDLIAGLPHEGMTHFIRSFNELYAQQPNQLQLGFLKVLKGSEMERKAAEYQIVYREEPPYEVLSTHNMCYEELNRLHEIEHMVDLYYNSGRFSHMIAELVPQYQSPFDFFDRLARYFEQSGCNDAPPSKIAYYELLGDFSALTTGAVSQRLQWLCRLDMAMHEKIKKNPSWMAVDGASMHRRAILAFYSRRENIERYLPHHAGAEPKLILKVSHVEIFPFNPLDNRRRRTALLFNYHQRDVMGRAAVYDITDKLIED